MEDSIRPQARKKRLVIETLADETLVFDQDRNKAHCLDRNLALIWKYCDGKRSIPEIASKLRSRDDIPADEDVVRVAVHRLGKVHLLEDAVKIPERVSNRSRREWLRKVALVGGLSVASLLVPTAAQAQSCPHGCWGLRNCTICYNSGDGQCDKVCCKGHCVTRSGAKSQGCWC